MVTYALAAKRVRYVTAKGQGAKLPFVSASYLATHPGGQKPRSSC